MTQWWERSPPTNVAWVRLPVLVSHVGWVCCWFLSLLREVFLRVLQFSPLLRNQHFQIPIISGAHEHVLTSFPAPKCFVGKQNLNLNFLEFFFVTLCNVIYLLKLLCRYCIYCIKPFKPQYQRAYSPHCSPYISCGTSWESLLKD